MNIAFIFLILIYFFFIVKLLVFVCIPVCHILSERSPAKLALKRCPIQKKDADCQRIEFVSEMESHHECYSKRLVKKNWNFDWLLQLWNMEESLGKICSQGMAITMFSFSVH